MVKIRSTRRFQAILFVPGDYGWHATDPIRDRCGASSQEISDGAFAGEHKHGPVLARRSELGVPEIPSGYSTGHAASVS
jgi:hypothetical protein